MQDAECGAIEIQSSTLQTRAPSYNVLKQPVPVTARTLSGVGSDDEVSFLGCC